MKKLLILFVIICLVSCSSIPNLNKESAIIDCPRVYFSAENSVYVDGNKGNNIDLEEIRYKASLNNYGFDGNCVFDSEYSNYKLDLLIITEPFSPKDEDIELPIFVLLYDSENQLIGKEYFRVSQDLTFNTEKSEYETTDIIGNLNIFIESDKRVSFITIGFVNIN